MFIRRKFTGVLFTSLFILLIPTVSAYALLEAESTFSVIPNKTYSDNVCVINTESDKYYTFSPHLFDDNIFLTFELENEYMIAKYDGQKLCNKFSFSVMENKRTESNYSKYDIYVFESSEQLKGDEFFQTALGHNIYIDSSQLTYKDVLFSLSKKYILFFISIYAMFALLLYIINSKKFNE